MSSADLGGFNDSVLAPEEFEPQSEYVQVYTDGRIEGVHTFHLRNEMKEQDIVGVQTLYDMLSHRLPDYGSFLADRDIQPPIFMYLTFVDAKGYALAKGNHSYSRELDRDIAILGPVTLESFSTSTKEVASDLLKEVWHAFGEFGEPDLE